MKMNRNSHCTLCFLAVSGLLFFYGCFGKTPPVHYYDLYSKTDSSLAVPLPGNVGIIVGPVSLPAAIDRPHIMERNPDGRLSYSEYNRWAGPLQTEIPSALAENIGSLLKSDRVLPVDRENLFEPDYHILISVNRFERQATEGVVLDATWSIKKQNERAPLLIRKSLIREQPDSESYGDIVKAHSRALAKLSHEMATALSKIAEKNRPD